MVRILKDKIHRDSRGCFISVGLDSRHLGVSSDYRQVNISTNKKAGTVRGIHFSTKSLGETKFVSCINGELLDFVVNLDGNSDGFGSVEEFRLSALDGQVIIIPPGFGHAFQTLAADTILCYRHTQEYEVAPNRSLSIFDTDVGIKLPMEITEISWSDRTTNLSLRDIANEFTM